MSASNKQNMDDITSESAKGLEKVVELTEKRFKANGVDMTALLKRSEKNNITALEKVIENATHLQEETSRRQKIEFERIARKAEEIRKITQADTRREIKELLESISKK